MLGELSSNLNAVRYRPCFLSWFNFHCWEVCPRSKVWLRSFFLIMVTADGKIIQRQTFISSFIHFFGPWFKTLWGQKTKQAHMARVVFKSLCNGTTAIQHYDIPHCCHQIRDHVRFPSHNLILFCAFAWLQHNLNLIAKAFQIHNGTSNWSSVCCNTMGKWTQTSQTCSKTWLKDEQHLPARLQVCGFQPSQYTKSNNSPVSQNKSFYSTEQEKRASKTPEHLIYITFHPNHILYNMQQGNILYNHFLQNSNISRIHNSTISHEHSRKLRRSQV